MKTNLSAIVNKKVIKEAKSNKSVPTPKKVVNKQAKIVCVSPFKTNLKDQSKKSPAKQTPKKKKKKSSEHPDSGKSPRRSSPRFKNTPEEPHNAEKTSQNSSEEPHDAEKTTPTRSSARKTESEVEPVAEKTTPTRSSLRKRKSSFEPEQSQPLQSTSGASQVAPSSEVVKKQKYAKRRLYTGPCPNVQVRNVNDTFSDLQDSEDEEDEDDEQEEKGNEEVENENVENEDEENENDGEDHGVENENETEAQAKPKRKYVPRGPTRMSALGLTNGKNGKEVVSFNNKDHPIGDPSVQLASVLGVMVRRNIALKHRDWRRVPKEAKDNIWAVVQQRFVVNEFYKDYYVGKMGCYLKEARSRKFGKILALDELEKEEREKKLAALKPDNSTVNEWEEFVKHVCSEEFRTKRFWMQQIRKKYTTPHTISRLGWARLEAKMQKERKTQEQIDRVEVWTTGHKQKE